MLPMICWTRWIALALVALVLAGSFGVASATARSTTPPSPNMELEKAYALQQQQLPSLDGMLVRAEHRTAELVSAVARAKAAGKNTASVDQALIGLLNQLRAARAAWNTAAGVLQTHTGFGNDGKVTNADQARVTVRAVRSALEQSYYGARSVEEQVTKLVAIISALR